MDNTAGDPQEIEGVLGTYAQSLCTDDADLAASLYTEDGIFVGQGLPITKGGDDLLGIYQQLLQAVKLDIEFHIDDVSFEGDLAYAVTHSNGEQMVLATGDTSPESNRELFVFRRRDGEWKIARYMFFTRSAGD